MELKISSPYKSTLVGSAGKREILYPSDKDFYTKVPVGDIDKISSNIRKIVARIHKNPNLFFKELKGGMYRKKKARWTLVQVLKGRISKNFTLNDIWNNIANDVVKLDFIKFVNKRFVEMTIVFELVKGNYHKVVQPEEEFETRIQEDIKTLLSKGKYWKALKRLYVIKPTKKLLDVFNSDTGFLSQVINDIHQTEFVKAHYNVPKKIQEAEAQIQSSLTHLKLEGKSLRYLEKHLNGLAHEFIRQNNISFS